MKSDTSYKVLLGLFITLVIFATGFFSIKFYSSMCRVREIRESMSQHRCMHSNVTHAEIIEEQVISMDSAVRLIRVGGHTYYVWTKTRAITTTHDPDCELCNERRSKYQTTSGEQTDGRSEQGVQTPAQLPATDAGS